MNQGVRQRVDSFTTPKTSQKDPRHPLYLGEWNRSIPYKDKGIAIDKWDEPHLKRKHEILKKHPEITKLYGIEPFTKYYCMILLGIQLLAMSFINYYEPSYVVIVIAAYVVGGTVTSIAGLAIHECAHNLAAESALGNRLVSFLANSVIVFPIAASFKRYHLMHHTFQGVTSKDPDLPLDFEWKLVKGNTILKFIWMCLYSFWYVLRGAAMQKQPTKWEIYNWIFCILNDLIMYNTFGYKPFIYMTLSLLLGFGCHPGAAHFIQEHFTFDSGQETYSYYGWMNQFWFNVGYQ
eukprot:NODE_42_length_34079_cov_0.552619.p5 type:complete len:292 gc:universal NODE_42_length_34079_cov_0.552619:2464-1589(-)